MKRSALTAKYRLIFWSFLVVLGGINLGFYVAHQHLLALLAGVACVLQGGFWLQYELRR